jgi:hypothetical protein
MVGWLVGRLVDCLAAWLVTCLHNNLKSKYKIFYVFKVENIQIGLIGCCFDNDKMNKNINISELFTF